MVTITSRGTGCLPVRRCRWSIHLAGPSDLPGPAALMLGDVGDGHGQRHSRACVLARASALFSPWKVLVRPARIRHPLPPHTHSGLAGLTEGTGNLSVSAALQNSTFLGRH